jgi:hypothetical protein
MTYLVREDGEHFVIPSYRDVLSAKQKNQLKKDILLLSQNYGEYITLQRKNATQYEVTFSPDTGYLLGETIWQYFKRPLDMIYCEIVPNTTEAILVIVKDGSVYLDGRFPMEGIPEELVGFLTQKNNFDIYIYGDVPIAEVPTEDKFAFDAGSVKSFNKLNQPVFAILPLLKTYQLQLVEPVLKAQGIGILPVRQGLMVLTLVGIIWILYSYISLPSEVVTIAPIAADPYQTYVNLLNQPAPDEQVTQIVNQIILLSTLPGWEVDGIKYSNATLVAKVKTPGSTIQSLLDWAKKNAVEAAIKDTGIELTIKITAEKRLPPKKIYSINEIITQLVDRLNAVYPGNNLTLALGSKDIFSDAKFTINFSNLPLPLLKLIGLQFKDLPIILQEVNISIKDSMINGSIIIDALGNPS